MNPAEAALAKLIGERLGDAGKVTHLVLGRGSVRMSLELAGQGAPVELAAEGLCWEPDGDHVLVRWERLTSSLVWADRLLTAASARTNHRLRLPDSLRLAPLKFLLPRAEPPAQPSK